MWHLAEFNAGHEGVHAKPWCASEGGSDRDPLSHEPRIVVWPQCKQASHHQTAHRMSDDIHPALSDTSYCTTTWVQRSDLVCTSLSHAYRKTTLMLRDRFSAHVNSMLHCMFCCTVKNEHRDITGSVQSMGVGKGRTLHRLLQLMRPLAGQPRHPYGSCCSA